MIASPHGLVLVGSVIMDDFCSRASILQDFIETSALSLLGLHLFLLKDVRLCSLSVNSNLFAVQQLKDLQFNLSLFLLGMPLLIRFVINFSFEVKNGFFPEFML